MTPFDKEYRLMVYTWLLIFYRDCNPSDGFCLYSGMLTGYYGTDKLIELNKRKPIRRNENGYWFSLVPQGYAQRIRILNEAIEELTTTNEIK